MSNIDKQAQGEKTREAFGGGLSHLELFRGES